jgi:hypothetical protein
MDNKFILVPSDLYKNMLKPDRGEINVENTKRNLNALLNKRKMDKSAKNLLYNQELRRYMRLRKEFDDKPVKVELTDGSFMLFNPKKKQGRSSLPMNIVREDEEEEEGTLPSDAFDTAEEEESEYQFTPTSSKRTIRRPASDKRQSLLYKSQLKEKIKNNERQC